MKQNVLMAGQQCLVLLLLLVPTLLQVRSYPAFSKPRVIDPYKWKMSCFDFMEARYKVILDENLPSKAKMELIEFFLSKVEEECDNIHIN